MRTIREFEERLHREFATGRDPRLRPPLRGRGGDRRGRLRPPRSRRLHRQHASRPRARDREGLRREGDDGGDLRQEDRPVPRQGRLDAHRRPRQGHARRERDRGRRAAARVRGGALGQGARDRPGRRLLHRRRRLQPGHVPREPQPRRRVGRAVRVRGREQRLRRGDVDRPTTRRASTSPSAPTASACRGSSSTATTSSPCTRRPARRSARARSGGGPTLLECKVNRYFGHFEGDAADLPRARRGRVDPRRDARLPRRVPSSA